MRFCRFLFFPAFKILILALLCIAGACPGAQAQQVNRDSLAQARQHILDSSRTARQHTLDSTRTSRQHTIDSMKTMRMARTDSLTALRKYRESRRYRDSVDRARKDRVATLHDAQQARLDSMKTVRKASMDSLLEVRRGFTDAVKSIQKSRSDSLASIRKYKEGKRYADSVAIVRRERLDSMHAARKVITDSAVAARKQVTDSTIASRKKMTDSLTASRVKFTDSLKAIRKVHSDSLLAAKDKRDKVQKAREDKKQKDLLAGIEIKIKKKHEAWNNDKMLKKKWNFPRQALQNTFTRYNYYFNANRKMDEALANMQRIGKDNYDSVIALYAFNPDRDSTLLASDMDSIIQKASLGIQIHDPRTKWGDDLYLLLGQAYYYKGDYENAIASFNYIVGMRDRYKKKGNNSSGSKPKPTDKELKNKVVIPEETGIAALIKHKPAANDALLWLVRSYTQSGHIEEAEIVLDLLSSEPDLPENMKSRLALEKAFLELRQHDYQNASGDLAQAVADKGIPDETRRRAAFINGQLLQQKGGNKEAADYFSTVIGLHPKLDMDFYARKFLAGNLMNAGGDQQDAIASLKRMLNDNKYAPYWEQVYYILGRLSANGGNAKDAITYLQKSLVLPKTTRRQKAITFAALGNLYYSQGNYLAAEKAYDSVKVFSNLAKDDADVALALRRGKVLKDIVGPSSVISTQDSLLALAGLSEKERLAVVRKYLRGLQQRQADSTSRAENAGINAASVATSDPNDANPALSWYFSNPQLMQSGLSEFKRKWGNRPLADNWRRAAALGFSNGQGSNIAGNPTKSSSGPDVIGSNTNAANTLALDENGFPTEESLLSVIPTTDVRRQQSVRLIQRAYVDLGTAYINQLEDYPNGSTTLDTFDNRYPTTELKAEELYLRYQLALRQNQLPQAQTYSSQLLNQYGSSSYAGLVRPTSGTDESGTMIQNQTVGGYYDETYALLQNRSYNDVLQRVSLANARFNDPRYNNRFVVVKGMALAGNEQYGAADTLLSDFISRSPTDSLKNWAESVLQYIRTKRPLPTPAATGVVPTGGTKPAATDAPPVANNGRPIVPQPPAAAANLPSSIPADTANAAPGLKPAAATAQPAAPAAYTYNPAAPHYFVFAFSKVESRALGVKAAAGDFNTLKFSGQNLIASLDVPQATQGYVIVQPFRNAAEAKIYLNQFRATPQITRDYKSGEYETFIISDANYLKLKTEKDDKAYLSFYGSRYK